MAETGNKGVAEEGSPRSCEKGVAEMRTIGGTEEWQGIKPLILALNLAQRGGLLHR